MLEMTQKQHWFWGILNVLKKYVWIQMFLEKFSHSQTWRSTWAIYTLNAEVFEWRLTSSQQTTVGAFVL